MRLLEAGSLGPEFENGDISPSLLRDWDKLETLDDEVNEG
jgi:hypothetical protein